MEFYIQWCEALQWTRWCSCFKQLIRRLVPCKLIFWKSYQSCWASKFSKLISQLCGTTMLCHIIIRLALNIFLKTLHILQNDAKIGSQNILVATKFGFAPDCSYTYNLWLFILLYLSYISIVHLWNKWFWINNSGISDQTHWKFHVPCIQSARDICKKLASNGSPVCSGDSNLLRQLMKRLQLRS